MKKKNPDLEKKIRLILTNLPSKPGVYRMFDEKEECIYVGKAKDLKKRVTSYFRSQKNMAPKVKKMVEVIANIMYTEVNTELEALILESNYIKQLHPRFNILLRDDKHYCYIKITAKEDYPRIYTTRKVLDDGAWYFGPKTSSSEVFQTLKLLRKLFPFRTCDLEIKDHEDHVIVAKKTIKIPCIYYHIHRCIGPCIVPCKSEYRALLSHIVDFLNGNYKKILDQLREKMMNEAKERKFEQAAKTRDLILSTERLMEKQIIDQADIINQDVIGCAKKFGKIFITLFQIRNGKIIGQENFTFEDKGDKNEELILDSSGEEIMHAFFREYYSLTTAIPDEVLLPYEIEGKEVLEEWLTTIRGTKKVRINIPSRGMKNHLLELAHTNALSYAEQQKVSWMTEHAKTKGAAKELADFLGIPAILNRIECYDISHLSGTNTVASMVVFKEGSPSKKDYRRFHVKTRKEGDIDDFASLQEILERRLKKIKDTIGKKVGTTPTEEDSSFGEIPDLIIIDGGKGQLSSVMEIAEKLQVEIPIISLAKREEEIFVPNESESLMLPRNSHALYLVQNIRDEAHRFAITFNRNLRGKKMVKSQLDSIPGVGPKIKKLLLKTFGDLNGIKNASQEDLEKVLGQKKAAHIKEYL